MASLKDASPLVPFDLYDFFGYIFPGIFFWISLALWGYSCSQAQPIYNKLWCILNSASVLVGIFAIISFLVLVYITGHFIATLSHLMDRVLVAGISGYPVYYILDLKRERREYSDATVKYIFILINIFLITPVLINRNEMILINIIIVQLVGVLILIRMLLACIKMFPYKNEEINKYFDSVGTRAILRFIIRPAKIIDLFFVLIKRVFQIDKNLPVEFIKQYEKVFQESFKMDYRKVGSENYWLPYFLISRESPDITNVIRTWLHLYGFARNISAAAYLTSLLIASWLLINPHSDQELPVKVQLLIMNVVAIVFVVRFYILYSTYYTKNIIRSFVVLASNKKQ